MMQRMAYVVMPDGLNWKVKCNGVDYPFYSTRDEAVGAAVPAAYEAGKLGYEALVLIQDAEGRVQVEWTYGHRPKNLAADWRHRQAG
ncbi:DUF2188 domain-containing protein [Mesorhizobium sp. VNQ89]|uniref:DUF2188 domain-containing protein n=1 Tax=Mesorhizobium quangtriensis TaxID=3157709 RepID=UPI0032B73D4F